MRRRFPARRRLPARDVGGFQLLADLRGSDLFIAVSEDGGTRKSIEAFYFGQLGDDVFGDAVAKIFVFLDAAEIFEIEDGDGFGGLFLIGGRGFAVIGGALVAGIEVALEAGEVGF